MKMEEKMKRYRRIEVGIRLTFFVIWLALIAVSYPFLMPKFFDARSYKDKKEIWLPENYRIIKNGEGEFASFHLISFKKLQEELGSKEGNVYVQKDGIVHYVVQDANNFFVAKTDYLKNERSEGRKVLIVTANGTMLEIHCGYAKASTLLFIIVAGLILGVIIKLMSKQVRQKIYDKIVGEPLDVDNI